METPYPSTNHYRPVNHCYGQLQDPSTCYILPYTSMADIRKQVDEGQDKWRQGVDLMFIPDVNNYIKFKTFEYRYFKFMNINLWE